jgi:hypothetical protein
MTWVAQDYKYENPVLQALAEYSKHKTVSTIPWCLVTLPARN